MSMVDLKRMQGSPPAPTESKRRWNKSFSDKNLLSASLLLVSPTKRNNSPRHEQPQQKQQRRSMMALSERFVGIKNETFSLNLNSDTTSSLSNSSWGSVKPSSPSSSQSFDRSLPPRTSAVRGITNRRRVSATPRNSVSASRPAPQKSCLKEDRCRRSSSSSSQSMRRSHKTSNMEKSTVDHRMLQFTTATIHEHGVVLGDNPSVSVGAPIQIDWVQQRDSVTYDIDLYEMERQEKRKENRKDLLLPVGVRARLLLVAGYTIDDIANATIAANKIKILRCVTANQKENWERLDTLKDGMIKTFRNLLVVSNSNGNTVTGNNRLNSKPSATVAGGAAAATKTTIPCTGFARTA